jgi:broad specificity phosphatase PhoE
VSQDFFGFLIAIFNEQRARLAEAAKAAFSSRRGRPAETADRLLAIAQCVDQRAGAEPSLGQ